MAPKRLSRAQADEAEIENQHAVVTSTTAMDRERDDEIEAALDADREMLVENVGDEPPGDVTDADAWDDAIERLAATGKDHLAETMASKVEALRERTERSYPSLLRLRFRPEEPFEFVPGQYVRISYEEEAPRVYSIASSPNREELELCIRRVPGGELTPDLCDRTVEGDDIFVRGPYGDEFMLQDPSERDLVFVATGTGAAPFKSMIDYTFEEGLDECEGEKRDVWLFLGSSWKDDLPYREAFLDLAAEHDNFHPVMTCSREEYMGNWDGETEYVQHTLLKYLDPDCVDTDTLPPDTTEFVGSEPTEDIDARIDPTNAEVYVCGIGAMCSSVREVIEPLGVPDLYYEEESYG
ncbi:FAD-binding oxidoreductase [Halococcus saccharolyticus]|uniref:Oxidoreductase FAD-binding domain-containing protein n=1 Tax=Halococcus saccharolyticus DSM 5350 TaxID=1227455 RepID=M0MCU9_9EURY|nr:FAD-binding oxidoreductase [Halococcus saccharolyticus]EMA43173.1 oxidoreductase FAD-binding domain-containing protein [Halococcus saccharolyticus DSM 5350]